MLILRKFIVFVWLCLSLLACQPLAVFPEVSNELSNPTVSSEPAHPETATPAARSSGNLSQKEQGNADVEYVRAVQDADGSWTFHVTVRHPDQGWEDYADGWDIVLPDGQVFKPDPNAQFSRTLLHPHVDEQPFTRSLSGIVIPAGITEIQVRAHDLVNGFGGQTVILDFREISGTNYSIEQNH